MRMPAKKSKTILGIDKYNGETVLTMTIPVEPSFLQRQQEIDQQLVGLQKRMLAVNCEKKLIADEKKELDKKQQTLWFEEHGPNMSFFQIWERITEEEKK